MNHWKAVALILGGVLMGMLVARPESSRADAPQSFKECGFYCGFDFTRKNVNKLADNAKPVPEGWTVVSAADAGDYVCTLLCR